MTPQLHSQEVNVVVRGQFNPSIFQPSWLANYNLIRESEAESAEVEIIHPDASIFQVDWLQMRILRDNFLASTVQEPYFEALRDLVKGIFTLLKHTPVKQIGINRNFHYRMESEAAWHTVGHKLAPKEDWNDILDNPGMMSLTMEGKRSDNFVGYVRVTVEPSKKIQNGVFVKINDHYDLTSQPENFNKEVKVGDILDANWDLSMLNGNYISKHIIGLGI